MKTRFQLSALLVLSLLWAPLPVGAQKTAADAARAREVDAEARAKNLADTQERYKVLDRFAGSWSGDFKVVQGSPLKEVPAPGTLEAHWALDNKWLQSETNFQLPEGAKFQNLSFFGYNSGAKQYKRFVLTSGDSREVLSTGTWDEASATFVFTGPMINPYSGDNFERRDTFRFLDADQIAYTIDFVFQDKTEIHVIEGIFKRKK